MRRIAILSVFIILAVLPCAASDVGDSMPGFANPDLAGTYAISKNLTGRSWLVLDFFATDCEPCKKELPELEALGGEFAPSFLRIFVFATDPDGESAVKPFFRERTGPCTVLIDRYKVTSKRFGVEQIPSVFLVDPSGIVRYKATGYQPETVPEMRKILREAATAGRAPGAAP